MLSINGSIGWSLQRSSTLNQSGLSDGLVWQRRDDIVCLPDLVRNSVVHGSPVVGAWRNLSPSPVCPSTWVEVGEVPLSAEPMSGTLRKEMLLLRALHDVERRITLAPIVRYRLSGDTTDAARRSPLKTAGFVAGPPQLGGWEVSARQRLVLLPFSLPLHRVTNVDRSGGSAADCTVEKSAPGVRGPNATCKPTHSCRRDNSPATPNSPRSKLGGGGEVWLQPPLLPEK